MFKKPFNRVVGETRECKHCNLMFHTFKPRYRCDECIKTNQKKYERLRRQQYEKKLPYPYQGEKHDYNNRFYPLRAKLHKMKVRSEWQTYFKIKLDEVFADEVLMKWINDRRDLETKNAKIIKSRSVIKKETPDTRGHYEY